MKFITIVPTKFMQDALLTSDTTLVLAHLIEEGNEVWRECLKFKKLGGKIIMDNSFYELRRNMPLDELAKKAKLINADIVVLPDIHYTPNLKFIMEETVKKIKTYLPSNTKLMATVFADNKDFKEDLENFKILNNIEGIDIIAIPYVFRKEDEFRRPDFLNLIEKEVGLGGINKEVHLFGCNSLDNIKKEKRKWVSSIDGTMGWKVGFYKISLPVSPEDEPSRPKHYFDIQNVDANQREIIVKNLKYIKEVCL